MTLPHQVLEDAVDASSEAGSATHSDDDRWSYPTCKNVASVEAGLLNASLDILDDEPLGEIVTHACDEDGVPLNLEVETEEGHRVGVLASLSAEQAEALAVDLLEQALAHREQRGGTDA